jgi:hypothetical protein
VEEGGNNITLLFNEGANNVAPEYGLPAKAARQLVNLDPTQSGGVRSRKGLQVLETWDCHSLYPHPAGGYLVVHDGGLYRVAGGVATLLVSVAQNRRVRYAELNHEIYWSNGSSTGRVTTSGAATFWGLPFPGRPTVTAGVGVLEPGTYLVTHTAVVDGVESGAPDPVAVTLTERGGLTYSAPSADATVSFYVYATPTNGTATELRRVASVSASSTAAISGQSRGIRLRSYLASKPPAGQWIAAYRGRLWIAKDQVLWFTDSESPHWVFTEYGYLSWPDTVTLLVPVADGLYVGDRQQTWFLSGSSPNEMITRKAVGVGAVPGTGTTQIPFDVFGGDGLPCAAWLDSDGVLCCGRTGGAVQRITQNRYRVGQVSTGEIVYRVTDGIRQLLVVLDSITSDEGAAEDVPVAETYSH